MSRRNLLPSSGRKVNQEAIKKQATDVTVSAENKFVGFEFHRVLDLKSTVF
jgi:hypothetical protein